MNVNVLAGDCLEVLPSLDENSHDSCVTDPPYHLTSIVKRFGGSGAYGGRFKEENGGTGAAFARMSRGFMGKQWDGGDVAFRPETWAAVYRVLKPGAHLLACGGTRTFHRMACAIEDAGFEIRDTLMWVYGSGFPKSHDVSKGIDKLAGTERTEVVGLSNRCIGPSQSGENGIGTFKETNWQDSNKIYAPATDAARQWEGWGTALKPAVELICLARKPLSEKTVAANVLKWGTGAINVDGCRVAADDAQAGRLRHGGGIVGNGTSFELPDSNGAMPAGRWPANLIHDGSKEVVECFPESESSRGVVTSKPGAVSVNGAGLPSHHGVCGFDDAGSAARFFYTAKADADDRVGSKHPTVKPLDLVQYLVRLVTPKGGLVLDPFAGTGTTGEAAFREGMRATLIEREAEYQNDIRRRIEMMLAGPDERARAAIKASGKTADPGPLFAGIEP